MKFLRGTAGQAVVEWLVGAILVIAVVGTIVMLVASTTATQGDKTNTWIGAIPNPSTASLLCRAVQLTARQSRAARP